MMASMTGGNRKAELAPTNMVAVMATPRRATNQAPTVLCTESWPAIMAPMLAKTPKQAKYAAGDVTTNTMHRLAASMTTAPMVMVKPRAHARNEGANDGRGKSLDEYEQGKAHAEQRAVKPQGGRLAA